MPVYNLYNNNYNSNSLSDTTILNRNSFVRYTAYNLLVIDNFYSLDSNTQLLLTQCCLKTFSLTNVPELEGSRYRLLQKSVATVCICVLSCMSFLHAYCCWLLCSMHLLLMCMYTHKLLVTLVICCNNRAAFVCVVGLVIVVALAFLYF